MNECKFKRPDGVCEHLSDDEVKEYCVEGPCTAYVPVEYIRREYAISAAKHAWAKGLEPSQYIEIIDAADVKEVVNCCDCKACKKEDDHEYWCFAWGPAQLVPPDGWCYHGERRTEK